MRYIHWRHVQRSSKWIFRLAACPETIESDESYRLLHRSTPSYAILISISLRYRLSIVLIIGQWTCISLSLQNSFSGGLCRILVRVFLCSPSYHSICTYWMLDAWKWWNGSFGICAWMPAIIWIVNFRSNFWRTPAWDPKQRFIKILKLITWLALAETERSEWFYTRLYQTHPSHSPFINA